MKNPSQIKNKVKRNQVYAKYKAEKKKTKLKVKTEKEKEREELGELAPKRQIPHTLENQRVKDDTMVEKDDAEVLGDEKDDEFSAFFNNDKTPKLMITTRPKCSRKLYPFIGDLMQMIPNSFYYPRETHLVTAMAKAAHEKNFTHLVVLAEKEKVCNGLLVTLLPAGPTAFFKLSSFVAGSTLPGHGKPTNHIPELIINQFGTRLGRRVGRFLGSLFPHQPQYEGRQVVTLHNQRDFIFVRHHRYIYRQEEDTNLTNAKMKADVKKGINSKKTSKNAIKEMKRREKEEEDDDDDVQEKEEKEAGIPMKTRARLQELGPRFTLKLKWLQEGLLDTQFGEYEWIQGKRNQMKRSRRKFFL